MKKKQKIKYDLIIFDCDGTIVNSEPILNKMFSECMVEMGYAKYTPEYCLKNFTGWGYPYIAAEIIREFPEFSFQKFEKRFIEVTKAKMPKELQAIPNAEFLLEKLAPYKKCVASNGENAIVKASLKITGLNKFFKDEHIFTYEMVKAGKPAPDLFLYAAEQFNVKPQKCLVIEDSLPGITGALNAGIDTLAYRPHKTHPKVDKQIKGLKVLSIIKDLKEVLEYI